MPKSRDKLKYRVEKYLMQIKGEERKEANLKAVLNAYLKQELVDSYSRHSHNECHDGSHDKHSRHSRHSSRMFCAFFKDKFWTRGWKSILWKKLLNGQKKKKKEVLWMPQEQNPQHWGVHNPQKEAADKQLNWDLTEIAKILRLKFEAEQKDGRTWKEKK